MSLTGPMDGKQFLRDLAKRQERLEQRPVPRVTVLPLTGTSDQRPTADTFPSGTVYFDTTLGKPLWAFGASWVLADGTALP